MAELKPGVRALLLAHPHCTSMCVGKACTLRSVPYTSTYYVDVAGLIKRSGLICDVDIDGIKLPPDRNSVWPASALLPLPPDDEAERLFGEREVVV